MRAPAGQGPGCGVLRQGQEVLRGLATTGRDLTTAFAIRRMAADSVRAAVPDWLPAVGRGAVRSVPARQRQMRRWRQPSTLAARCWPCGAAPPAKAAAESQRWTSNSNCFGRALDRLPQPAQGPPRVKQFARSNLHRAALARTSRPRPGPRAAISGSAVSAPTIAARSSVQTCRPMPLTDRAAASDLQLTLSEEADGPAPSSRLPTAADSRPAALDSPAWLTSRAVLRCVSTARFAPVSQKISRQAARALAPAIPRRPAAPPPALAPSLPPPLSARLAADRMGLATSRFRRSRCPADLLRSPSASRRRLRAPGQSEGAPDRR